jgi:acyl-CoA synthetase (NDP forming)
MQISEIKDKPVVTAFLGGQDCDRAIAYLLDKCVPAYNGIAMAVDAMAALFESTQLKKPEFLKFKPHKNVNRKIVQKEIIRIRNQERTVLTEVEAKKIIAAYGIPVISSILARNRDEAEVIANKLGYPVAMKIASMDILHKSDAGGVKLNIKSDLAVKKTFNLLIRNAISYNEKAVIEGVTIQKMAKQGTEIIIGAIQDKTFGPVVMFGMGGILVEVLDDVIFRVAPINVKEARKMVEESRAYPLFRGIRGQMPRDIAAVANYISCISQLIYEFPEIGEIDINPVFIYQQNEGCIAVDARILLTENIN